MLDQQRTLVLLRHAKSSWNEDVDDMRRPLADRGRRDAPAAGQWLVRHVPDIDLVVCSPATRARQTWTLVSHELRAQPRVRYADQLYAASAEDLLGVARQLHDSIRTAVFVGHNPGFEDLVYLFTGKDDKLKTSAIAVLIAQGSWSEAEPKWARLESLAAPRG